MRGPGKYILFTFLLLCGSIARAQNSNNLIAGKDKLILLLDLNSSKTDLDSIFKRAGIKNASPEKLKNGDYSVMQKDGWQMVKRQQNILQFNHALNSINNNPPISPFVITTSFIKTGTRHGFMDYAVYGVNKFTTVSVYDLPNGMTRFILPGYLKSRRVFLSGGFNDWSTLKGAMTKTTTGWVIDIKLPAGAWMYKFIADSRWFTDPNNAIVLNDGGGNENSVYYKYNYVFRLTGYPDAKKVALAGSFNSWNTDELPMQHKGNTWECPLFLREGMHAYRFWVDGHWVTDPANPDKYKADDGILSSYLNLGQSVGFKLMGHTNAHDVSVAGDFNGWKPNRIHLKRSGEGWALPVVLPAGNYQYRFIVDGEWMTDPANQSHGVENGQTNSFISVSPNHTFRLKGHENAHNIIVSGSFNNWNEEGYTMSRSGDDWILSMHLKPGKYLYKFIIDGNWILDPGNKLWEQNEFNTGNSVLWIENTQ